MDIVQSNHGNADGMKDSINTYLTIKGMRYYCWVSFPSQERMATYRAAGVRFVRRGVELFVHNLDTEQAAEVDAKLGDK